MTIHAGRAVIVVAIEDSSAEILLIARACALEGAELRSFADSDAAALYFMDSEPVADVVILDRLVPGRDWHGLLGLIRSKLPHCPVVVFSAADGPVVRLEAVGVGARFVPKPRTIDDTIAALRLIVREVAT